MWVLLQELLIDDLKGPCHMTLPIFLSSRELTSRQQIDLNFSWVLPRGMLKASSLCSSL